MLKHETRNGTRPEPDGTVSPPSLQDVRKWIESDLVAAGYFLNMLRQYPEVLDKLAEELYKHSLEKEKGSAIKEHENAN